MTTLVTTLALHNTCTLQGYKLMYAHRVWNWYTISNHCRKTMCPLWEDTTLYFKFLQVHVYTIQASF